MSNFDTNVLIIGKSGVGKSSLLNYIFGKQIEETGSGEPVTKEGIYPHKCSINTNFCVTLYDTWGLEPDKAARWKKLIMDEIKKHDASVIADWFHTIFYCISAKSERIEDFDIEMIKNLHSEGNNVILIFTKADAAGQQICDNMRKSAVEHIGIEEKNIIFACSTEKKLLGKKTASTQFGKEEILSAIQRNAWINICNKLPYAIKNGISTLFDEWESECIRACSYIDKRTIKHGDIKSHMQKKLEEISQKHSKVIHEFISSKVSEASEYYSELVNNLKNEKIVSKLNLGNIYLFIDVIYIYDPDEELANKIAKFVFGPFGNTVLAEDLKTKITEGVHEKRKRAQEMVGRQLEDYVDWLKDRGMRKMR